jgi:hypothetical protein
MTCNPHLIGEHGYIIVAMDYFIKWVETMPTFDNTGKTAALFIFNHIVTRFSVPQAIVTDHGSHFHNFMMFELTKKLGLRHENSTLTIHGPMARLKQLTKFLLLCFDGS